MLFDVFAQTVNPQVQVEPGGLPIVGFGDLLTFLIRIFFLIAGIAALFYGLRGALSWITSGGAKEDVDAARDKIVAAITGVFIIIVVISVIVALEQFVFNRQLCFGISCPASIPSLKITPLPGSETNNGSSVQTLTLTPSISSYNSTDRNNNSGDSSTGAQDTAQTPTRQLPATGGGGR